MVCFDVEWEEVSACAKETCCNMKRESLVEVKQRTV